jgi:flagellar basal body-associated protein FliL
MNRFLVLMILIVAGVLGLGFYLRWFHVGSNSADGQSNVTFTVDKDKIKEDEQNVVKKVQGLGHHVKDEAAGPTEKTKDATAPPVPPPQNPE